MASELSFCPDNSHPDSPAYRIMPFLYGLCQPLSDIIKEIRKESKMKTMRKIIVFCLFFSAAFLSGCAKKNDSISKSGLYFDTLISVTLYDSAKSGELEHCFEMADQYEHLFSAKLPDSDISRINSAGGKPVTVSSDTAELLELGLYYSKLSNGKFDITVGRLADLWDFQAENPSVPDADAIAEAIATIDYKKVSIDGTKVRLENPDAAIDLGGIAKGYIADKMKEYLVSQNIHEGIINLGGNVLAIGKKAGSEPYNIAIQKPFSSDGEPVASVRIADKTVVTSGTYERYFEKDGRRYHHILDVSTGYPYDNGLSGVTIICGDSADGDGLSTTCFALGLEDGMALVESLPDTEAVFITTDNKLHVSSGIDRDIPMTVY